VTILKAWGKNFHFYNKKTARHKIPIPLEFFRGGAVLYFYSVIPAKAGIQKEFNLI